MEKSEERTKIREKLLVSFSTFLCIVVANQVLRFLNENNIKDDENRKNGEKIPLDSLDKSETAVLSFMATKEQLIDYISLYEQPCHQTGYRMEEELKANPKLCGVAFTDFLLGSDQVNDLRDLGKTLIDEFGESTTVNRESYNLQWLNLHTAFRKAPQSGHLKDRDFELLINASQAAKYVVSAAFGIPEEKLFFTTVCQFTKYEQVTDFSEFRHVDKVRSPELVITSLLWLSTVDEDFGGGRLEFLNGPGEGMYNPILLEPKKGRYAAWTSSYENPHGVQELLYGQRFALIFAFTVNPDFGHKTLERLREWSTVNKAKFYF